MGCSWFNTETNKRKTSINDKTRIKYVDKKSPVVAQAIATLTVCSFRNTMYNMQMSCDLIVVLKVLERFGEILPYAMIVLCLYHKILYKFYLTSEKSLHSFQGEITIQLGKRCRQQNAQIRVKLLAASIVKPFHERRLKCMMRKYNHRVQEPFSNTSLVSSKIAELVLNRNRSLTQIQI